MLKKLFISIVITIATLFASMGFASAGVDVNTGNQAALDGIKGLGPSSSKAIIAERSRGGNFIDWLDLQTRVKGIREKNALRLSEAGLTVNGQSKSASVPVIKTEESAPAQVFTSK